MAYTSDEINGSQELRDDLYVAAMERMGVALEQDTDGNRHVVMRDPLVGLTEKEAADFKDLDPLTRGAIADIRGIQRSKYDKDYMKFERTEIVFTDEQNVYLESVKNTPAFSHTKQEYEKTAKENNDKYNKYAGEIELLVKANDPGYLNSLSQEDRDDICMQYTEYVLNHKSGVIGYTDVELSSMTDEGRENTVTESEEWVQTVMTDVKEKYPNVSIDNLAYPRSTEYNLFPDMKAPDYSKENKQDNNTVQDTNNKNNKDSNKSNSEKESPFKKLSASAAAVFTAAKNYLKETKIGQFVAEKYNELMHKDKNKDEKTNDQKTNDSKETKENTESNKQRDDGSDIVQYNDKDNSSQYGD